MGCISSSPFEITVIPAALDVSYTLNDTYEIAADREDGLAVAYAGEENLWQFVARDAFGSIRLNNDTMFVDIVEVHLQPDAEPEPHEISSGFWSAPNLESGDSLITSPHRGGLQRVNNVYKRPAIHQS